MKYYRQLMLKLLMFSVTITLFSNNTLNAQQAQSDLQEVQQIMAIVNDELISLYDLKQRAMLLAISTNSDQITGDRQQYFQDQAMNGLIDDKLKLQEAKKYEALSSDTELELSFNNYAGQFNMTPEVLEERLNVAGVEKETLLYQINGTLAWQRVISGLLQPMVNVTDDEVMNYIEKLERDKGKFEYKVSEIFLLITDNAQREEIISSGHIMHEQLTSGSPFSAIAQQFSQSSTASVGGDLGWVMENEIPEEVSSVIPTMTVGDITEPIITEDGIYILNLTDRRKILTLNDDDIAVELKYLYFSKEEYPATSTEAMNEKVLPMVTKTNACELNDENGIALSATETGALDALRVGNLPVELKNEILNLEVGQGSTILEAEDGYRSYILCLKDIPEIHLPEFDAVLENMTQSRLQLIARRHLRDLRRDAIVDYR